MGLILNTQVLLTLKLAGLEGFPGGASKNPSAMQEMQEFDP